MVNSVVIIGFVVALISWIVYRRDLDGSQRIGRVVFVLSLISGYLMWAITYLAQLHPLLTPQKAG